MDVVTMMVIARTWLKIIKLIGMMTTIDCNKCHPVFRRELLLYCSLYCQALIQTYCGNHVTESYYGT
jgi:hypothetical protein